MFGWRKKPDVVLEPRVEEFPDEAEKVVKIKHFCWMGKMSADAYAGFSKEERKEEFGQYELNRYQKMLLEATNLARELRDEFYRDSALHFIIGLLMAFGDEAQAKKLYSVIEVDIIQDAILKDYPRLAARF
ncbi:MULTISPECIES: hypothetical protein [unclassified Bradyrhizobium]|uniref:hypothetical protein n=1 Tax=unclassified Bradyrhizobium TaxID=2631580 RepID=UPI001BAC08CB|nr:MULTISPECIES: hypothetical protein [unclassified Bradyrhizobium]MBR1204474.1 hypothetical protein [Bradyrhizobium sp. AUGA SZCCT0124]MBR1309640.1 hypothetical protein [Bradyrhizobium sp. AUGA SZCCT0051]MBR1339781.1 hypothetical protein [Bradyrhizobium sp. AUGA SZCCT0105]MBR1354388.1 hypothetical protein [Bradyrhizobium sp. AUGA SZCCT0045]